MIKNGIKNYFRNLKYFFTPLGTIALGVVLGLSATIPAIKNAVYDMFVSIKEFTDNSSVEFSEFFNIFWIQVKQLDWTSPLDAIELMLDKEWLTEALNNSVTVTMSVELIQIEGIVSQCLRNIGDAFAVFVVFGIIGFFCGYFVTKWLIRREIAKRSIWKYFMISFVDSLLSATLVTFSLWILTQWKVGVIISTLASVLLFGFIELFEAYLTHAWKKVDIKQIISVKNIAKLFCSNILIFLISSVFVLLAIAIFNTLTGIFVGIALVEIAFIVIGLNAEAYVKSVAETAQAAEPQKDVCESRRESVRQLFRAKRESRKNALEKAEENAAQVRAENAESKTVADSFAAALDETTEDKQSAISNLTDKEETVTVAEDIDGVAASIDDATEKESQNKDKTKKSASVKNNTAKKIESKNIKSQ